MADGWGERDIKGLPQAYFKEVVGEDYQACKQNKIVLTKYDGTNYSVKQRILETMTCFLQFRGMECSDFLFYLYKGHVMSDCLREDLKDYLNDYGWINPSNLNDSRDLIHIYRFKDKLPDPNLVKDLPKFMEFMEATASTDLLQASNGYSIDMAIRNLKGYKFFLEYFERPNEEEQIKEFINGYPRIYKYRE